MKFKADQKFPFHRLGILDPSPLGNVYKSLLLCKDQPPPYFHNIFFLCWHLKEVLFYLIRQFLSAMVQYNHYILIMNKLLPCFQFGFLPVRVEPFSFLFFVFVFVFVSLRFLNLIWELKLKLKNFEESTGLGTRATWVSCRCFTSRAETPPHNFLFSYLCVCICLVPTSSEAAQIYSIGHSTKRHLPIIK